MIGDVYRVWFRFRQVSGEPVYKWYTRLVRLHYRVKVTLGDLDNADDLLVALYEEFSPLITFLMPTSAQMTGARAYKVEGLTPSDATDLTFAFNGTTDLKTLPARACLTVSGTAGSLLPPGPLTTLRGKHRWPFIRPFFFEGGQIPNHVTTPLNNLVGAMNSDVAATLSASTYEPVIRSDKTGQVGRASYTYPRKGHG